MEILIGIVASLIMLFVMFMALYSIVCPQQFSISYSGDPDPNCPDCEGKGIVNEGHEHFECECPCKMVINP